MKRTLVLLLIIAATSYTYAQTPPEGFIILKVTVSSFDMGKYEVTQKEWREVMVNSPSEFKGGDLPVERMSWHEAVECCNKRSVKEGLTPYHSCSCPTFRHSYVGFRLLRSGSS